MYPAVDFGVPQERTREEGGIGKPSELSGPMGANTGNYLNVVAHRGEEEDGGKYQQVPECCCP